MNGGTVPLSALSQDFTAQMPFQQPPAPTPGWSLILQDPQLSSGSSPKQQPPLHQCGSLCNELRSVDASCPAPCPAPFPISHLLGAKLVILHTRNRESSPEICTHQQLGHKTTMGAAAAPCTKQAGAPHFPAPLHPAMLSVPSQPCNPLCCINFSPTEPTASAGLHLWSCFLPPHS